MLKNYFKTAWRNLVKNRAYSIINILGLSIGLAVCMLITLFVKDEFSFDQFQQHKKDIYRLVVDETSANGDKYKFGITGMAPGPSFEMQIPELLNMVRIGAAAFNIKHKNEIFVQNGNYADSSFFQVFTADFVEGNADKALSDPSSIVISEEVAKRFFGEKKALGQTLAIERNNVFKDYTITGVTKNSPLNSSIQINLLMPFDYQNNRDTKWLNFYLNTFFLLKKGANIENIKKQFESIFNTEAKIEMEEAKKEWNDNSRYVFGLQPFLKMHLSKDYKAQNGMKGSGNALLSYLLSGLALFILIVACINFVNISISNSLRRTKEIGVRKVLGGQRSQLIWQFMSESVLLNMASFLMALILTNLALPIFNNLTSKYLSFSYLFDWKLIAIYFGIFLLTSFLAGFYPSLVLSRYRPVETLYGRFQLVGKNLLLKSLVVFQFGLATFFIILAMVQYRQVNLFTSKDLGYDDKNMVVVGCGQSNVSKGKAFMQELKKNSGIVSIAPSNDDRWVTPVTIESGQELKSEMNVVDENYIHTLGLTLSEGRGFSAQYPADSTLSVMVNEAFVKEAGWKNPIGQNVKVSNHDLFKVIGVIKDYHFASLYEKVRPQVFTSNNSYGSYASFYIKTDGKNIPQTLATIKATFHQVFPTKPYAYDFLTDINNRQYENEYQMKQIIFWSAFIIISISCMGLFGLTILTTEKRRKEIGVRKVMGASIQSIVKTLSLGFVKLVLLSFVIVAPIAYYTCNKLLENYPYRIKIGADLFLFSLAGLLFITIATISFQAIKAAVANPVKSLRTE